MTFVSSQCFSQTLEQAVVLTLQSNTDIKAAFNEFQSSKYQHEASEGAYLPKVFLDASIGHEGLKPSDELGIDNTNMVKKEVSITLSQLIWDGSSTLYDID